MKLKLMRQLFLPLVAISLLLNQGCATTPAGQATQAEVALINTVDVGMQVWHDYVVAGKATQSQINTVEADYNIYYNAQQVAKAAIEKWIASNSPTDQTSATAANAAVVQAEQALLNIINSFATPLTK